MITAPLAGMMLADLGAEVIKVEHPEGGDPFRSFRGGLYSPHFVAYNRGKRSIKLDLRNEAGRDVLRKLLGRADVLLENYRAGVMERLGLGDDALAATNAKLIHCSITGFGASGPYSGRPAYDSVGLRSERHRQPFPRSEGAAGRGPDHPRQRHRHVRRLRHSRRAVRARAHRPRPADRGQHARSGDLVHPRSVRQPHPAGHRERSADAGGELAFVRVPLRRRQAARRSTCRRRRNSGRGC